MFKFKKEVLFIITSFILILLFSFGYYNEWDTLRLTKTIPVKYPKPFKYHTPKSNEKFLAYLPHSGFHNQRIELENGLLLANYLNRTLLIPPVYLSNPAMPWLRYNKLYERLLLQTKSGLEHCSTIQQDLPLPNECLNTFRWTNVPWTFFYDLSRFEQPIIFRPNLDPHWLYHQLDLTELDLFPIKDSSPYEYQIDDAPELNVPLSRYTTRLNLTYLRSIPNRLIQFGSLFGSYRVLAEIEPHVEQLRTIRSKMIFDHPVLTDVTSSIVKELGGTGEFVGIHLRVGDGIFKLRGSILVDDIYHALVDRFTDLTVNETAYYEGGLEGHEKDRTELAEYEIRLREFHPASVSQNDSRKIIQVHHEDIDDFHYTTEEFGQAPDIKLGCALGDDRTQRFSHTVIYIATDAPDPRHHPLLKKLFRVFPCTFTLSDFGKEIDKVKRLEVVEEKVKLDSYLIPIVDAMISAHGHTFFGTPHSTFSSYIERQLHPFYTGKQIESMTYLEYLATHDPSLG